MLETKRIAVPAPLVVVAGWLVPGAGYWLIGQRVRGIVCGVTIIALFLLGLFIAGVRVLQVPGFDDQTGAMIRMVNGRTIANDDPREYPNATWALIGGGFVTEVAGKPWFVGQVLAGPISLLSAAASVGLAQKNPADYLRPHAPLETVGTLYTAIAGMLNLMVLIDAAHRASQPAEPIGEPAMGSAV